MNAILNIQVRVASQQARAALAGVDTQLTGIKRNASGGAGTFAKMFDPRHIQNAGKNLQWIGRQLTFNFTLPLVAAGAAATKWSLDNQRAMTQVRKVYGDMSEDASMLNAELEALEKSFRLLSDRFGVHQQDVIEIGAAWAQAGSAGVGLAKSTRATLEAMILGSMDAEKAVEGLIAVQSVYRLNSDQLHDALAQLNIVENQTGISFEGLIDVVTRAGGAARVAGIDIRHLAAMAAALVPATGGAAQAGNALRTIISRLMAPTRDTIELLDMMGINVLDASWQMLTGTERVEKLAESFDNLSQTQKNVVASVAASRWQVSRFNVLMQELNSTTGFYQRALAATADQEVANATYRRELLTFLQSTPQAFAIATTQLKNFLAEAIVPLLPTILAVITRLADMARAFSELSPEMQQLILMSAVLLAVIGPVVQNLGALGVLAGTILQPLVWLSKKALIPIVGWLLKVTGISKLAGLALAGLGKLAMGALWALAGAFDAAVAGIGAALTGLAAAVGLPVWAVVAIIAAVIAAIVLMFNKDFREAIFDGVEWIARGIAQLPGIFSRVFVTLARVVQQAVQQIVEWLSYLNPFARHSPSLVESVTDGIGLIVDQYGRLLSIVGPLEAAARAHRNFLAATTGDEGSRARMEFAEERSDIAAYSPGALPAFDVLVDQIATLRSMLPGLEADLEAQELVVRQWERALDQATDKLDDAREVLDSLRESARNIQDELDGVNDRLNTLANTPIEGMRAMSDAIFENEMAQNRLRLEILKLEESGQSIDEVRDKYSALEAEINSLMAQREALRYGGAGSDVLGFFNQRIDALRKEQDSLEGQTAEVENLQAELERLQRQGEMLRLEESINFDPQLRQIDQMINGIDEMSFADIVAGIQQAQSDQSRLNTELEAANRAIKDQEAVVAVLEAHREDIADQLDTERDKVEILRDAYNDVKEAISDMEGAIRDYAQTASQALRTAQDELSNYQEQFLAGIGVGDYEIPGGDFAIGREGGLLDIEEFNRMLEEELRNMSLEMGEMDIFKPIKDAWNTTWGDIKKKFDSWVADPIQSAVSGMATGIGDIISWLARNLSLTGLGNFFGEIAGAATTAFGAVQIAAVWLWQNALYPVFSAIAGFITMVLSPVFSVFQTVFETVWGVVATVLTTVWTVVIQPIFEFINNSILTRLIPIFQLFAAVVEIAVTLVWRVIQWAWDNVLAPVFGFIAEWVGDKLTRVFDDFGKFIDIVWSGIQRVIEAAWSGISTVFGFIVGIVAGGLSLAFTNFRDHVIIPVWNGIGSVIGGTWTWLRDNVLQPIVNFLEGPLKTAFEFLKDNVVQPVWDGITRIISGAWNTIATAVETGANFLISAFNAIAGVVNRIAGALNIDVHIDEMPKVEAPRLARGGILPESEVGNGKIFNSARAIVGEGSKVWPEYAIPTDPRYRQNALHLYSALGARLGTRSGRWPRIPETDAGTEMGGFPNPVDAIRGGAEWVSDRVSSITDFAIDRIVDGALAVARPLVDQIPIAFIRKIGHSVLDYIDNWGMGAQERLEANFASMVQAQDLGGGTGWQAIVNWLRTNSDVPFRITSTLRPGSRTRSGALSRHALGLAVDLAGVHPGRDTPELLAINNALLPIAGTLRELIYSGPGSRSFLRGRPHTYSAGVQADHHDHVHAALRAGGRVRLARRVGGTLLRVAEGRNAEEVQVLPIRNADSDGKTYNFYGDLSFPNITSGDDAEKFIRNLEAVVG